jgi:hypothetical protein
MGKVCGDFRWRAFCRAVAESALVCINCRKFEVGVLGRDIIHYGRATVYALVPGAGSEGKGMLRAIRRLSGAKMGS